MRRYGVLLVMTLALGAWHAHAGDDRKGMEGKWTPLSAELGGVKIPETQLKAITLTLADGKYTAAIGDKVDAGTYKVDAGQKPKSIDITGTEGPNKGKTILAIYELDKDTLRVCYNLLGKDRPSEFVSSKEKPYFLVVYQRAKP